MAIESNVLFRKPIALAIRSSIWEGLILKETSVQLGHNLEFKSVGSKNKDSGGLQI